MRKITQFSMGILCLVLIIGCDTGGDTTTETPAPEVVSAVLIPQGHDPLTAIPKDFAIDLDVTIGDDDLTEGHSYSLLAYLRAGDALVEMGAFSIQAQSNSTVTASFSVPQVGLPPVVDVPYRLFFQLHNVTSGVPLMLAESQEMVFQPGQHTADYVGYIHYWGSDGIADSSDDNWTKVDVRLFQYGNLVIGNMTKEGSPNRVEITAIANEVTGELSGVEMEGFGVMESDDSLIAYSSSMVSLGDGRLLVSFGYSRDDSPNTMRGAFHFKRLGDYSVNGTVTLPSSSTAALQGSDWRVALMFSFFEDDPENGAWDSYEATVNGNTLSFSFDNVPHGDYYFVFMTDLQGQGFCGTGDGFGVAGSASSDSAELYAKFFSGSLTEADLTDFTMYNPADGDPLVVDFSENEIHIFP